MRFSIFSTVAAFSGLGLAVRVAQAPNPADIVAGITGITAKFQDLMGPAILLNPLNAPLMLIGGGPWATVLNGFTTIVTTITTASGSMPPVSPGSQLTGTDASAVIGAVSALTATVTSVVGTVAQAGSVVAVVPGVGPPLANVLRKIDNAMDELTAKLTGSVAPGQAGGLGGDVLGLQAALGAALGAFS
ncbi:hypothetical protein QBC39DRAFT_326199 [Podospora conica]|nr:hypothetical protein QBC39DRAFT_326199 [Schizothecium conicum]